MKYTEEQVLKAIYESGLHQYAPKVLYSQWRDGIDVDVPTSLMMNFVRKLTSSEDDSSQKATITFTDGADYNLNISIEFDPEITDATSSNAVNYALKCMEYITEFGGVR